MSEGLASSGYLVTDQHDEQAHVISMVTSARGPVDIKWHLLVTNLVNLYDRLEAITASNVSHLSVYTYMSRRACPLSDFGITERSRDEMTWTGVMNTIWRLTLDPSFRKPIKDDWQLVFFAVYGWKVIAGPSCGPPRNFSQESDMNPTPLEKNNWKKN